jgi:hypothetical protein
LITGEFFKFGQVPFFETIRYLIYIEIVLLGDGFQAFPVRVGDISPDEILVSPDHVFFSFRP